MQNPWAQLPTRPPYVLDSDRARVEEFNRTALKHHAIDTSLLPEPFLGNPNAKVVILGLNPGWSPQDAQWHAKPEFQRDCRANLLHSGGAYPFYLLNPALTDSPGGMWWRRRLRVLIEAVGLEPIAANLLCVEYFPYHTDRFHSGLPRLPSQEYAAAMVQNAIAREAIIILMRSAKLWTAAIPALADYPDLHRLSNPRCAYLTPRNCPAGYREIVETMCRQ